MEEESMYPAETTEVAATGTARTGSGKLLGGVLTAGADAATATIYDNTSAAGKVLRTVKAPAGTTVDIGVPACGVHFGTGLHAVLAGTGPKLYLEFS
ncbi:MAG: hypothetical protein A3J27_12100 [Candidatus Tectomicrobia bacterium RIFCSPLOWO2_12_FULL_69_37]|nr:MAG: hypothetical protein A3I72_12070 [Candidatus Tectomicrobia bacterium RIFCSPLOWO2_02_FULL_70_19]OGL68811.1 MAG: hypothetical protein A3J27_12100 [Candidatus Tectomicrobia bacterium RIFCSPLOWO2_12_FULL_69_37]